MMKRRFVHAVCAFLVMTVLGCVSLRGDSEEIHTYHLGLDGWHSEARPADANGPILLVSLPQAEPGFETSRMIYIKRPYELESYAVNQWADTPARMFTPWLVQALTQSGVWRDVVTLPSSVPGEYRLDSYGFAVQQEFLQQPSRVRVTIRAQLVDVKQSTIVGRQTFEAIELAPGENAYGGVLGANRAVVGLLGQIVSWLQACVQHSPECRR
jgi:cholesterol transport system auxiliary component